MHPHNQLPPLVPLTGETAYPPLGFLALGFLALGFMTVRGPQAHRDRAKARWCPEGAFIKLTRLFTIK
jgi:hypothetical protein